MSHKNYAVFGLGAFGSRVAEDLSNAGHFVVACDVNPSKVNVMRDKVIQALVADVSDEDVIKELNVSRFDTVILSMSKFFEKQMIALTYLKKAQVKVIAKASSKIQETILYRLGADEVIRPEHDVAQRLCRRLSFDNVTDIFDFKGEAIAEVIVPSSMHGKTLIELDLRGKYNITVLLINKPADRGERPAGPNTVLERGDSLTVFGNREAIIEIFKEK